MQRSDLSGKLILSRFLTALRDHSAYKARKYRHKKLDHINLQSDFDKNLQCGNKIFQCQLYYILNQR